MDKPFSSFSLPRVAPVGACAFERMGRNKLNLKKKEPKEQMPVYNKRINGFAKKGKELSILCDIPTLILSFTPKGKANLFLGPNTNFEGMINMFVDMSPKERSECKMEGIKALKKAFKGNTDHEIDEQQLMNLGRSRTSHAIQQGQQSSNMTQEMPKRPNLGALIGNMSYDHLNLMEAELKNLIQLHTKKKMEMSILRDRASASTVQHLTNQAAKNHPGLLNNGNPVNHGTNLLQPNMNSGSNSDLDSDFPMAAPQEPFPNLDDIINRSDYDTRNVLAYEGGFCAWAPGN